MNALSKWLRKRAELRRLQAGSRDEVFQWIHDSNKWGSSETPSGKGSQLDRTTGIRAGLGPLLNTLNVSSMLDLPCGDLNWLSEIELPPRYIGADIVPSLIEANRRNFPQHEFHVLDACSDALPSADLILMRDLLVHLSFADIALVLANVRRSGAKFLAATTYPQMRVNKDIVTGKHRQLNLELPPFSFAAPVHLLDEQDRHGKWLGVWAVDQLPD